jgi:hypothetical protein
MSNTTAQGVLQGYYRFLFTDLGGNYLQPRIQHAGYIDTFRSAHKRLVLGDPPRDLPHSGVLFVLRDQAGTPTDEKPSPVRVKIRFNRVQRPAGGGEHVDVLGGESVVLVESHSWYFVGVGWRLLGQVQLEVRACGLVEDAARDEGGSRSVRFLYGENIRALGHGVLHLAEKVQPGDFPPFVPPHRDALDRLGRHEVLSRRPRDLRRIHQQLRAHHHVHVLHAGGDRTPTAEVPLVEKIYHKSANGN